MFLQTIMLAARARGLHTCPEAAIASYPDIVRRELGITKDWIVICGMAMGYADPDDIINTFQPPRIEVDEFAVFLASEDHAGPLVRVNDHIADYTFPKQVAVTKRRCLRGRSPP